MAEKVVTADDAVVGSGGDVVPSEGEVVVLREGVVKTIKKQGSGETPAVGKLCYMHYVGYLEDGTIFDSSRRRGATMQFNVGESQVIEGWDLAALSMRTNELAVVEIAAESAYGKKGAPPFVPPNAKLTFEMEMMHFKDDHRKPISNWTVLGLGLVALCIINLAVGDAIGIKRRIFGGPAVYDF